MQSVEVKEEPVFSPLLRRYTLQEFWALPEPEDRCHYDLIGGYLFIVPPPAPPHGSIDSRLNRSLVGHLLNNNLKGEVHHPHEPIYTSTDRGATYLEPDMMYVSEELARQMGRKRTSADIVFEYASKSTAIYDRTTKSHRRIWPWVSVSSGSSIPPPGQSKSVMRPVRKASRLGRGGDMSRAIQRNREYCRAGKFQ